MSSGNVVIISAFHDYRTLKRASVHHIAEGFIKSGYSVTFISTRYSLMSRWTNDSRLFLWGSSGRVETYEGVDCYLQRTLFHPFASRNRFLNKVMPAVYSGYAGYPDRTFDALISKANFVIVESSVALVYIARIKRCNPKAKIIYYATDLLDTVGGHACLASSLEKNATLIDTVVIRSKSMAAYFPWAAGKMYLAEFGIDKKHYITDKLSPFEDCIVVVGVGSMLFDPTFFQIAAPMFPHIEFHMIGAGAQFEAPDNVILHSEMSFKNTIPYIKNASVGVAPYKPGPGVEYLAESSLKLAQFEYLGKPTVCPFFAVGESSARFGYIPGDPESIKAAVENAISQIGKILPKSFGTWSDVAERIIRPEGYPEVKIES